MKLFIIFLILASFIQTSLIPLNLALILLICRGLIMDDKLNYYLAFFSGLLIALLSSKNLGITPLLFLIFVKLTYLFKKFPFSSNLFIFIPICATIFFLANFAEGFFFQKDVNYQTILTEVLLSIPVYLFIRFWNERFFVSPVLKLKIKK